MLNLYQPKHFKLPEFFWQNFQTFLIGRNQGTAINDYSFNSVNDDKIMQNLVKSCKIMQNQINVVHTI